MLKKTYRLSEREVKRVLRGRRPFFSRILSLLTLPNRETHARFAIVIGNKNIPDSVTRNFFRRRFYTLVASSCETSRVDHVFLIKRGTVLSRRDPAIIAIFESDIRLLLDQARTPSVTTPQRFSPS